MTTFADLFEVMDKLLGPEGCPWDREQTVESLRPTVLEETHELVDAINSGDAAHMAEELGDLAFNVVFFCRLGEKQGLFTTEQVLQGICHKLVSRHPHVFGDTKLDDTDAVLQQWEAIKDKEKSGRESALDGIPASLPSLLRAVKVLRRLRHAELPTYKPETAEEEFGAKLLELVREARANDIDPESALLRVLGQRENAYRIWEQSNKSNLTQ